MEQNQQDIFQELSSLKRAFLAVAADSRKPKWTGFGQRDRIKALVYDSYAQSVDRAIEKLEKNEERGFDLLNLWQNLSFSAQCCRTQEKKLFSSLTGKAKKEAEEYEGYAQTVYKLLKSY